MNIIGSSPLSLPFTVSAMVSVDPFRVIPGSETDTGVSGSSVAAAAASATIVIVIIVILGLLFLTVCCGIIILLIYKRKIFKTIASKANELNSS